MNLYTKTGDDGTTGLFGGQRVSKDDIRVTSYGEVDELNAVIGLAITHVTNVEIEDILKQLQSDLFSLGGALATPPGGHISVSIDASHISQLEAWLDLACAETEALRTFILPGGCQLAATLHVARGVCRRAERSAVSLSRESSLNPHLITYLNRLSDLLFALARLANHRAGVTDIPWIAPT